MVFGKNCYYHADRLSKLNSLLEDGSRKANFGGIDTNGLRSWVRTYMVKFIILGHGRNGSTLIVKSLDEHPNVRVAGELFHSDETERCRAFHALNRTYPPDKLERHYYRDGQDGAQFLKESVFYERPWKEISAVGFKLFYIHARKDLNIQKAWRYLLENKEIRVIHLLRADMLASYLSLRVAFITKEWKLWKGTTRPRQEPPRLRLEPAECAAHFNQILAWRQWANENFREHPFLEIEYERDVCARFEAVMNEIHDFLDLPRVPARQLLEKQAQRPPREAIINYDELKQHFRYTLYEQFFV